MLLAGVDGTLVGLVVDVLHHARHELERLVRVRVRVRVTVRARVRVMVREMPSAQPRLSRAKVMTRAKRASHATESARVSGYLGEGRGGWSC